MMTLAVSPANNSLLDVSATEVRRGRAINLSVNSAKRVSTCQRVNVFQEKKMESGGNQFRAGRMHGHPLQQSR
jgi:hypothetical protein